MADQEIVNAIKEGFNSLIGGNSSTITGTKGGSIDVGNVSNSILKMGQAIVPVITGFNNLTTSTTAFSDTLKAAANKLPIGGGVVKTIAEGREIANEAGKQGLGAGSFTALNLQAAQAGMTISQYAKTMQDADGRLQGFGRNASVAGENFADTVQRSIEGPLGQQMRVAGIQTEEIAKSTAVMGMATKANMSDAKNRQDLANATAAFALQIDETARLTGKSRESITNEIDTRLKSVDSQLDMQLMTEEQRAQYAKTQAQLADVGPTIQNAAANIASGQQLTNDTIMTLTALGPAGDEFQRAIAAQQNATTAADKQAADAALEKAKADILAYTNSREFALTAKNGTGELQDQMKKLKGDTIAVEGQRRAAEQEATFTGKDPTKAVEAAKSEVIQNQQLKDAQGRQLEGAVVMGELNKAAEGMRKAAVGAAGAVDSLNKELGKTPERLKPITDILKAGGDFNKTSDQNRKNFEDLKGLLNPTSERKSDFLSDVGPTSERKSVGVSPENLSNSPQLSSLIEKNKVLQHQAESTPENTKYNQSSNSEIQPVGIKELYDVMNDVNKNIMIMVNHTQSISDSSDKAARYASESSGSRI